MSRSGSRNNRPRRNFPNPNLFEDGIGVGEEKGEDEEDGDDGKEGAEEPDCPDG